MTQTWILIGLLLAPQIVHAEPPARAVLRHEGAEGVWFRADVAERLLSDVQAARLTAELAPLYERKIELLEEEIEQSQRLLDLAAEGELRAVEVLDQAIEGQELAELDLTAWHRSPVVWFVVGAATTALVGVGAAFVAR